MSDLCDVERTEHLAESMPHVKFIVPTAATMSVTLNGGMPMPAWYDIVGLDDRAGESCDGIDASCARIRAMLAAEHAAGLPYHRMALAGFSQGGAMSLFCGLQQPAEQKLAGALILSGYCPGCAHNCVHAYPHSGDFCSSSCVHPTPVSLPDTVS